MSIAFSIIPIAIVILAGYATMRSDLVPKAQWGGVEALGFKILIPAMLISSIYDSDLSLSLVSTFILVLIATITLAGLLIFLIRLVAGNDNLPNPQFTTVFQSTTRWNVFIALAAGAQIVGDAAPVLMSIAIAFLVPLINMVNVIVLSVYGDREVSLSAICLGIARNPLVIACAAGLVLNVSGINLPGQMLVALDMVAKSAIAVGLLAVGAGIDHSRLLSLSPTLVIGVFMRMVICPAIFLLLGSLFGLDYEQTLSGMIVCAVPAASIGYIVAKQMGGDAELYARILTWQTVIAAISIPTLATLAASLFHAS